MKTQYEVVSPLRLYKQAYRFPNNPWHTAQAGARLTVSEVYDYLIRLEIIVNGVAHDCIASLEEFGKNTKGVEVK